MSDLDPDYDQRIQIYRQERKAYSKKVYTISTIFIVLAIIQWIVLLFVKSIKDFLEEYYYVALFLLVVALILITLFSFIERLRFLFIINWIVVVLIVECVALGLGRAVIVLPWLNFIVCLVLMAFCTIVFLIIGAIMPHDLSVDVIVLFLFSMVIFVGATVFILLHALISLQLPYAFGMYVYSFSLIAVVFIFLMYHAQTIHGYRYFEMRRADYLLAALIIYHDFVILFFLACAISMNFTGNPHAWFTDCEKCGGTESRRLPLPENKAEKSDQPCMPISYAKSTKTEEYQKAVDKPIIFLKKSTKIEGMENSPPISIRKSTKIETAEEPLIFIKTSTKIEDITDQPPITSKKSTYIETADDGSSILFKTSIMIEGMEDQPPINSKNLTKIKTDESPIFFEKSTKIEGATHQPSIVCENSTNIKITADELPDAKKILTNDYHTNSPNFDETIVDEPPLNETKPVKMEKYITLSPKSRMIKNLIPRKRNITIKEPILENELKPIEIEEYATLEYDDDLEKETDEYSKNSSENDKYIDNSSPLMNKTPILRNISIQEPSGNRSKPIQKEEYPTLLKYDDDLENANKNRISMNQTDDQLLLAEEYPLNPPEYVEYIDDSSFSMNKDPIPKSENISLQKSSLANKTKLTQTKENSTLEYVDGLKKGNDEHAINSSEYENANITIQKPSIAIKSTPIKIKEYSTSLEYVDDLEKEKTLSNKILVSMNQTDNQSLLNANQPKKSSEYDDYVDDSSSLIAKNPTTGDGINEKSEILEKTTYTSMEDYNMPDDQPNSADINPSTINEKGKQPTQQPLISTFNYGLEEHPEIITEYYNKTDDPTQLASKNLAPIHEINEQPMILKHRPNASNNNEETNEPTLSDFNSPTNNLAFSQPVMEIN